MISSRHTLIPKCILTSVFWSSYQKQRDSFFSSWFPPRFNPADTDGRKAEGRGFCASLPHGKSFQRNSVFLSVAHWAPVCFSGCADIDWRVVAVWVTGVQLLPLGCSNASLHTVQSQERSSRDTPKTPGLPGFTLADFCSGYAQIDIADVCWSAFYVAVRPAARQSTAPSPWCWAPQTESFSNDTLNCSFQFKFTSCTIESSRNHAKNNKTPVS